MDWIRPLDTVNVTDTDLVGGKAAHLGALLQAGFNVPGGFVITTDAFVDHFGLVTDPLVRPPVPRLNSDLMSEVGSALLEHLGRETDVVVRSSSTEEDGSFASFAGQHSTYYFVDPMRIDEAIVDCWMSLWSHAAVNYRRAGWGEIASGEPLRMAVIVQRMVLATRSGVAFSRHPVQASEDGVIEASWGLGAAVVDGRVTPDHARVDEHGHLLDYAVSDKRWQILPHRAAARLQEVPPEQRSAPVLNTAETEHIANLALQLETLFDAPQDVEWAYEQDDLYLLQSRAITSRPDNCDTDEQWVLFKPLAENFTEPLTPLSEDLVARVLPKVGAFYRGRMYLPVSLVQKLAPYDLSAQQVADLTLLRRKPELRISPWATLRAGLILGLGFLADGANWIRAGRLSRDDLAPYTRVVARLRNLNLGLPATLRRLVWGRHAMTPMYHQIFTANISAGRYFLFVGMLHAFVARCAPAYPTAHLPATYHGDRQMHSLDMLNELQALGELADTDPDLRDHLDQDEPLLPTGHPFTKAFEEFLQRYGHRGPREMEFAAPRWRETPGDLLRLILASPPNSQTANTARIAALAARDELHQQLTPWQRRVVAWLTSNISRFIALRENTRHYHIMAFACMREKILDIERELLAQGKIKQPGDVFFLRADEVEALQKGWMDAVQAQQTARTRRRQWQVDARRHPVETINIEMPSSTPDEDTDLSGQCAAPGYATGIARVLLNPQQGHELQPGDILIAPYTDPAWTPLFSRCSAVVVGTGSFLSHAGTIARELQVPCIVDVRDCTRLIRSGDELAVDATHGRVTFL